ncbi:hypothetical protein R6Q59_011212 [Mikania micrantha]
MWIKSVIWLKNKPLTGEKRRVSEVTVHFKGPEFNANVFERLRIHVRVVDSTAVYLYIILKSKEIKSTLWFSSNMAPSNRLSNVQAHKLTYQAHLTMVITWPINRIFGPNHFPLILLFGFGQQKIKGSNTQTGLQLVFMCKIQAHWTRFVSRLEVE